MPRPGASVSVANVGVPGTGTRAPRAFPPCGTGSGKQLIVRSPATMWLGRSYDPPTNPGSEGIYWSLPIGVNVMRPSRRAGPDEELASDPGFGEPDVAALQLRFRLPRRRHEIGEVPREDAPVARTQPHGQIRLDGLRIPRPQVVGCPCHEAHEFRNRAVEHHVDIAVIRDRVEQQAPEE